MQTQVKDTLKAANIDADSVEIEGESLLVKFKDNDTQLKGRDALQNKLGDGFVEDSGRALRRDGDHKAGKFHVSEKS